MERFKSDRSGAGRESNPELVGPYLLLSEIGRGELATVHLAKKRGALGFQRLYALKRLKPALAGSLEHVELLLDEARLVSGVHHANIAGVLDVGTDAGSYVVMEYIEGESLETLLARAAATRHPRYVVPPLVDLLHGLHAVHMATDEAGDSCGIVHQAARARHVLVGVDGTARLVDFSQVRARSVRPSRSRSERLKVAYMAPEQALHPDGVDLRADLFTVGITLWESLTGERLFAGDNDEQTFQSMLHRRIPRPSEIGLKPPRCFDAICMRALERDRAKRYASALEMARDLRDAALNEALYATTAELGQWVRGLAGDQLRERRRLSGTDMPSSGGLPLETPVAGIAQQEHALEAGAPAHERGADRPATATARGAGGEAAARAPTRPVVAPLSEDPYAPGRIHGSSRGAVELEGEQTQTPALGMRRTSAPLPREDDDEPTGRRSSLSDTLRPDPARRRVPEKSGDDVGRAATLPMMAQASSSSVRPVFQPGDAQQAQAAAGEAVDVDRTQPNVFVPARPGARRDTNASSPGAYSQVETRRGRSEPSSRAAPGASTSGSRAAPGASTSGSRAAPGASTSGSRVEPRASTSGSRVEPRASTPAPAAAARGKSFDDAVTAQRPGLPAEAAAPAERRTSPTIPARPAAAAAAQANRRSVPITEAPPQYVQRRDSSPTRMQLPDGPVGAPHRSFPGDDTDSEVRATPAALAAVRERIQAQAQARFAAEQAGALDSQARLAATQAPAQAGMVDSQARFSTAHLAAHGGVVDSLAPSIAASLTGPPEPRAPSGRGSWIWLASGMLVAIILLAVGVGIRQSIARPSHVLPSVRHAAQAPAPSAPVAPSAQAPAIAQPPAADAAPLAPADSQAAPAVRAPVQLGPVDVRSARKAAPALRRGPPPRAAAGATEQTDAKQQARPAGRPGALLPDNPY